MARHHLVTSLLCPAGQQLTEEETHHDTTYTSPPTSPAPTAEDATGAMARHHLVTPPLCPAGQRASEEEMHHATTLTPPPTSPAPPAENVTGAMARHHLVTPPLCPAGKRAAEEEMHHATTNTSPPTSPAPPAENATGAMARHHLVTPPLCPDGQRAAEEETHHATTITPPPTSPAPPAENVTGAMARHHLVTPPLCPTGQRAAEEEMHHATTITPPPTSPAPPAEYANGAMARHHLIKPTLCPAGQRASEEEMHHAATITPPPTSPAPPAEDANGAMARHHLIKPTLCPAGQRASEEEMHHGATITPPPTSPAPPAENATGAMARHHLVTPLLCPAGQRAAEEETHHAATITPPTTLPPPTLTASKATGTVRTDTATSPNSPGNMVLYPDRLISYYKWKSVKLGSFNQSVILQRSFDEPFILDWQYTGLMAMMLIMGVCNVIGDLVRNMQFPYPILFMAGGGVLGWYSDINESLDKFLQVTSVHPRVLMMIFLPAFVFRTAYNTDSRLFKICIWQILLVGIVGVITSSLLIGVILMVSLNKYGWTFENAYLFGSIASTTYPHMIINILQSTGQSKPLCVLLEGEYMIRDAYAMMVFYLIIFEIVSPNTGVLKNSIDVFLYWICGLIIGLVLGRIITYCAQRFFTNVNQLILITVSVTYLAFYLCEDIEDYSGVVAVASIGMMLGRAKKAFASNIGLLLSETWEILCFASETVVFILIGLMTVKNLNDRFDWDDLLLAVIVYIITNVSRIVVYLVLLPMLSRLGSGLSWQNAIVAMWGGLHGILSMLLALMAARTSHFVHIGPQFTILMTLIVVLTYLINGSSITVVLSKLGLLTVSSSRRANMRKALASLYDIRERHFSFLKLAKYFPMVNWKVVDEVTTINNPYNKGKDKKDDDIELGHGFEGPHMSVCPSCKKVHYGIPTENELKEMRRIAQLKMLHARKAMYWRQLERGMISKNGALFLVHCVENALAREMMNIDMNEIKALWTEKYFFKFYKYCFKMLATDRGIMVADVTRRWRILFFTIVSRKSFVYFYCGVIIIHDLIIIEEFATKLFLSVWLWNHMFNILNLIFTALYGIEIVFKVGAYGFYLYTRERLNNIDLILMVTCTLNVVIDVVLTRGTIIEQYIINAAMTCRLLNLIRTVRLFKRTMQQLKKLWSNMKHQQRDVLTKEKQARLSTGGGPAPELAVVDPDVVLIAPHLLVTAPTLFSSNNSADENKERYELVFDGNLSEAVEEAEAAAQTPTPTPVPAPASAPTQTLEEDGQESWISTTPKPDKRANTVYLTGIKKRKNEQNNEAELRVQRLKELVSQEKELHALKMRSEERLSQIREESETTMYMLKIKTQEFLVAEAAAKAKIAELQLAAVLAPK